MALRSLATQLALCLFSLFFLSSFKRVSAAPTGVSRYYPAIQTRRTSMLGLNSRIDDGYCSGCPNDPKPNHDIDSRMKFKIKGQNPWSSKDETVSFTVKDWMEGLQGTGNKKLKEANELLKKHGKKDRKDDEPLDLLSFYDRWIDGQIGGLGSVREHVYENNQKMAPLFEFRDIAGTTHDKFKQEVEKAETAVINLHKSHGKSG